jgi:hypothetical protein
MTTRSGRSRGSCCAAESVRAEGAGSRVRAEVLPGAQDGDPGFGWPCGERWYLKGSARWRADARTPGALMLAFG